MSRLAVMSQNTSTSSRRLTNALLILYSVLTKCSRPWSYYRPNLRVRSIGRTTFVEPPRVLGQAWQLPDQANDLILRNVTISALVFVKDGFQGLHLSVQKVVQI